MEHFFLLQLIDNKKSRGYRIPMIDLDKCKEVTAVVNSKLKFHTRGLSNNLL